MKIIRTRSNSGAVSLDTLNLGECYTVGKNEDDVYIRGEEKRYGGLSTRPERFITVTRLHDGRQSMRPAHELVTRVKAELYLYEED